MGALLTNISLFLSNPVVIRDMRIRMRGTRAYWNLAIYLAVLSLIAVMGYASSTSFNGESLSDPVEVQQKLQLFYYWIFEGLAVLITLIAPALTAVTIISEKKMQTLDLLVTTPMSSLQMLAGKLISSIAFILLLLALSIPASALCIILGGATIEDVLQSYALLAISGVLMAAIGLAASCSAKQPVQAIASTYGAVVLFLIVSATFSTSMFAVIMARFSGSAVSAAPPLAALFELNPFFSAAFPSFDISVLGLHVPVWIASLVSCVLLVRLILTDAAIKLGTYGTSLTASQRRQVLIATTVIAFLTAQSTTSFTTPGEYITSLVFTVSVILALSLFFLPSLFVPTVDEDGPLWQIVEGTYSVKDSFSHKHRGTLPYFQIWLFSVTLAVLLGLVFPSGATTFSFPFSHRITGLSAPVLPLAGAALYLYFYLSGLGFLLWSICRRAATWSRTSGPARAVSFLLFVFLLLLPTMIMGVEQQINGDPYNAFQDSPVRVIWLLLPYTNVTKVTAWQSFFGYGFAAYVLGLLIYPVNADVTPGEKSSGIRQSKANR